MAEQEEDEQSPTQLRVFSIVLSPPQLKLQLLCKQYLVHVIVHVLPQLAPEIQWPPQFDIGPQPLPQEVMHALTHTLEHAELPQPTLHVLKHPSVQLVKHQPSHERVEPP